MQADRFRRFGILGGGVFFSIIGLAQPFFTLYAQELGASTLTIGLLVTLRAVAPLIIAMPSGQLIDAIGPMRMLGYGMMLLILSLVLTALAWEIWLLSVSQLFLGASIIICASALQVIVSTGEPATRNEAINRYSMWMSGGSVVGPLLGGLIVSAFGDTLTGHRAAFAAAALAGAAFLVLLLVRSRSYIHPVATEGSPRARDVFSVGGVIDSYRWGFGLTSHRSVQFGLSATFIIMYIQSFYSSFLPLLLDHIGYSTMLISLVLVAQGLAGMGSRFVLGSVMKRASLPMILTVAGFVASLCLLLTPLAGPNAAAVVIVVSVMGAAVGLNLPVSLMIMVDAVGENERGKLMGLRLLVNRFAQILSPAMFGAVGGVFGLSAAFSGGGVFLLGAMCGFSALLGRSDRSIK
jgi:MFS family permease